MAEGPEKGDLIDRAREHHLDVRFLGAVTDLKQSAPFIYVAHTLLNPGYLGLSVNHALSLGTPVVAPEIPTFGRAHSPEKEFLISGVNGILTENANASTLASAIESVLDASADYSTRSIDYARKNLSIGNMVSGLVDALTFAQKVRSQNSVNS